MSEASEFQQYADEALRRALKSRTDKEKLPLIELAHTWTQAAYAIEHPERPMPERPMSECPLCERPMWERPVPAGAGCSPTDHRTAR
jgi:hypothetical protein